MLALALACASRALGDTASVSANVTETAVDAGQTTEYHIDVTNAALDQPPTAPLVAGLEIKYVTTIQSRQYGYDGVVHSSTTFTYNYTVKTNRSGRFIIPGQELHAGRKTLTVPPILLNVLGVTGGKPAGQAYFARLIVSKTSAYVGESVPAEVRVYFGWDVQANVDPSPVLNGDGFTVQRFTPPKTSVAEVGGEHFRVVTYKTALAGVKTGTIAIGPAELNPVVRVPRASDSGSPEDAYDDPYFNGPTNAFALGPPKQVTLHTEAQTIEIKPLPPGRPPDFSGAIGQFTLEAAADPRKVSTGDPVTMRLSVRGQGNFDRMEPPALTDGVGLRVYPATAKFKADDDVGLSGLKSFEQVLIAESARTSLPGYRFSYFDPSAASYRKLETPPLSVVITGATLAAPSPAAAAAATATPSATPPPRQTAPADILPLRRDFGRPRDAAAFLPLYRRAGFWEIQGAAWLLLATLGWRKRWQRRIRDDAIRRAAELHRQRNSLHRMLRQENTGRVAFYSAARRLAQLKAAPASEPLADLSPEEICRTKRLPPEIAGSVEEIFARHAELVYSGGGAAQEPVPPEERRAVLETLETLGRN